MRKLARLTTTALIPALAIALSYGCLAAALWSSSASAQDGNYLAGSRGSLWWNDEGKTWLACATGQ
jgi:hypothetical protein